AAPAPGPHQPGAVLEAVAHAAEVLLGAVSWEDVIQEVLAALGRAGRVGRAHLFRNEVANGERTQVLRAVWTDPAGGPRPTAGRLPGPFHPGFERWSRSLARGIPIHGRVDTFPKAELDALEAQGLRSIAVVPVFAGHE